VFATKLVDWTHQNNEAAIKSGDAAPKMMILANGGAVVAVLAFLGHIVGKIPATRYLPSPIRSHGSLGVSLRG
jgi:hypothetical protein